MQPQCSLPMVAAATALTVGTLPATEVDSIMQPPAVASGFGKAAFRHDKSSRRVVRWQAQRTRPTAESAVKHLSASAGWERIDMSGLMGTD